MMNATVNDREIQLEKFRYALFQEFSEKVFDEIANKPELEMSVHARFYCDIFALRVRGFVWAESLETIESSYPADWWEAFKERWFPAWLLKHYPVKHIEHILEAKALYPKMSVPEEPHNFYLHKTVCERG